MKATLLALTMATFSAAPAMAGGNLQRQVELSMNAGASFPVREFAGKSRAGYIVGVQTGFYFTPRLAMVGGLDFSRFGSYDPWDNWLFDVHWEIARLIGGVKYLIVPADPSPYLKCGLNLYWNRERLSRAPALFNTWSADAGVSLGGGVQVRGGRHFGGFSELLYNSVFTDGDPVNYLDLRAGITLYLGSGTLSVLRVPANVP